MKFGRKCGISTAIHDNPTDFIPAEEEEDEYPSSGSEYKRSTTYQDLVVKQTSRGKIHVTVTHPSDPSDVMKCGLDDGGAGAGGGDPLQANPNQKSIPDVHRHGLNLLPADTRGAESTRTREGSVAMKYTQISPSTTPTLHYNNVTKELCTGTNIISSNYINNNNYTNNHSKRKSVVILEEPGKAGHQATSSESGDSGMMDIRRLTVDSGICLCAPETEQEKQNNKGGSAGLRRTPSTTKITPAENFSWKSSFLWHETKIIQTGKLDMLGAKAK